MSTQELGTKETVVLEQFESKYGGERAMNFEVEFSEDPREGAWIDDDNVVSIMHDSVEKVGPLSISGTQADIQSWGVIKSDRGTEILELESSGTTTYIATEYVDEVCDLFDVELDTFIENTRMKVKYEDFPVVYDDPASNMVAVVAPYINK